MIVSLKVHKLTEFEVQMSIEILEVQMIVETYDAQ